MKPQIITVTLNPAIDHTIYEQRLGEMKEQFDIGGKGINVSKTLKKLGVESLATGFLGGESGKRIKEGLNKLGILNDFVWINEPTRVNVKRVEEMGKVIEQNAQGPVVTESEVAIFREKLMNYCEPGAVIILSGSIPRGIGNDIYARLIPEIKKKGARVFLDTSKDALKCGVLAGPDYIKPNEEEFLELTGLYKFPQKEELQGILNDFFAKGLETIIISCGEKGAWFAKKNELFQTECISVKALSTVGAGDAMTAGFTLKCMEGASLWEGARFAVATATGAVVTSGTEPSDLETVLQYELQVRKKE